MAFRSMRPTPTAVRSVAFALLAISSSRLLNRPNLGNSLSDRMSAIGATVAFRLRPQSSADPSAYDQPRTGAQGGKHAYRGCLRNDRSMDERRHSIVRTKCSKSTKHVFIGVRA